MIPVAYVSDGCGFNNVQPEPRCVLYSSTPSPSLFPRRLAIQVRRRFVSFFKNLIYEEAYAEYVALRGGIVSIWKEIHISNPRQRVPPPPHTRRQTYMRVSCSSRCNMPQLRQANRNCRTFGDANSSPSSRNK